MLKYLFILMALLLIAGCNEDLSLDTSTGASSESAFQTFSTTPEFDNADSKYTVPVDSSEPAGSPMHTPEPNTLMLLGSALAGLAAVKFFAQRKA